MFLALLVCAASAVAVKAEPEKEGSPWLLAQLEKMEPKVEPLETKKGDSPWLLVPLVTAEPKLGTSLGLLGGYLYRFDDLSPPSMFGAAGLYTTTSSYVGGVFARTYFGEDRHRLIAFAGGAVINNDYSDFLGSGLSIQTEDKLLALATRYQYRVYDRWFLGVQALKTNYQIVGTDALSGDFLREIGLTGFDSVAIGAVIQYDSRDDQNSPSRGYVLDLNNLAYREILGGSDSFDVYRLTLQGYWGHGAGHVLAARISNHWTKDAPLGGFASVRLRGYTSGQYLGQYMSSVEAEERLLLGKRWGLTLYAGVAYLYGEVPNPNYSNNLYPSAAGGLFYVIKPDNKMVVTLDYGHGKGNNQALYFRFGWGF